LFDSDRVFTRNHWHLPQPLALTGVSREKLVAIECPRSAVLTLCWSVTSIVFFPRRAPQQSLQGTEMLLVDLDLGAAISWA
jgi:hypothetical protein